MELAIIKTGGKQYKVLPGQKLRIEKIEGEEGSKISFDEVREETINDYERVKGLFNTN